MNKTASWKHLPGAGSSFWRRGECPLIGQQISHYQIMREIGRGGMVLCIAEILT